MKQGPDAKLLFVSPKTLIIDAIRTCYRSEKWGDSCCDADSLGMKDEELIRNIIKNGHTSTLEHSLVTFEIYISRGCLQELSRHRIGVSPSVQSTRYTLKRLIKNTSDEDCLSLMASGNERIDNINQLQLKQLKDIILDETLENDIAKYAIPEALVIKEIISFNFRSLRNFLELRLTERAHWEIRALAVKMGRCIPEEYKIFVEDLV